MTHTLGIDIGTYETKGVLVDSDGTVVATASRPHAASTALCGESMGPWLMAWRPRRRSRP